MALQEWTGSGVVGPINVMARNFRRPRRCVGPGVSHGAKSCAQSPDNQSRAAGECAWQSRSTVLAHGSLDRLCWPGPAAGLGGLLAGPRQASRSHGRRLLNSLRCATLHLLRALPRLVQEALHVTGTPDRWLRSRTGLLVWVAGWRFTSLYNTPNTAGPADWAGPDSDTGQAGCGEGDKQRASSATVRTIGDFPSAVASAVTHGSSTEILAKKLHLLQHLASKYSVRRSCPKKRAASW